MPQVHAVKRINIVVEQGVTNAGVSDNGGKEVLLAREEGEVVIEENLSVS